VDPVTLLAAVVALVAFPGGAYTLAAGGLAMRATGPPALRPSPWTAAHLTGCVLLLTAAALIPLPGAPTAVLPSDGAPANLTAAVLLAGAGVVCTIGGGGALRLLAAVTAATPLLALAVAASSLSLDSVTALSGARFGAARWLAAGVVVVLAPLLCSGDEDAPGPAVALCSAVVLLFGLGIALSGRFGNAPGVITAVVVLGAMVPVAAVGRLVRGSPLLAVAVATPAATVASLLAIISS
jgi:hypothetical protein